MLNKFFGQKLTKFVSVNFLCVLIASMGFVSCSDDDKDKNPIVGEWINNYNDYYQFNSNGTGRCIYLDHESDDDIEAIIENPRDPHFFDYRFNGNTLKMREYWRDDKAKYIDYTYEVFINGKQMKRKEISYKSSEDETEHFGSGEIETFSRYR